MPKWCFNYDSGEYEYIDSNGFSLDKGEFVYNWDDSEYRQEEEEQRRLIWPLQKMHLQTSGCISLLTITNLKGFGIFLNGT